MTKPKKPVRPVNDHVLIVKMPREVRQALERVAAARFLGMSAAVRALILEADARGKVSQ